MRCSSGGGFRHSGRSPQVRNEPISVTLCRCVTCGIASAMAIETTPEKPPHDATRDAPPREALPWWLTAAGAALLAIGFRLGQHVSSGSESAPARDVDDQSTRLPLAHTPAEVPAARPRRSLADWKAFLLRLYDDIGRNRIVALAAGVTFYSILALFPALAALVSLYGLFADPASIAGHLDTL